MINDKLKCIFIEVPKTGSTSIRSIVGYPPKAHLDIRELQDITKTDYPAMNTPGYRFINPIYKAIYPSRLKEQRGKEIMEQYFKFGFVRNPWSRTLSLYVRTQGIQMRDKMTFDEFVEWIQFSSDTCLHPTQKKNQIDWFKNHDGEIDMDFIGKFENINEDWDKIARQLGIDTKLPHLNKNKTSKRKHYSEYYTSKTKAIIAEKFAVDIEFFGYTFN